MSILDDSLSSLDLNSGFGAPHKRGRTTTMKRSYALGAMTLVLLIGTFVAVRLGQRSAENRQQASSPTGTVVVSTSAPASIQPGQTTSLTFAINTHDTAISGVQLTFHLEGAASAPTFESISGAGLDTFSQIVPGTASGYDVVILGVLLPPNSLNTAQNTVDFARLHFPAAAQVSAVQVTYDQNGTFTSGGANPDQDDLQTVANATFPIVQAATDTPTTTPLATTTDIPIVSSTPTNTPQVTPPVTPTATMCIQPSPPLCQPNQHLECIDQTGTDFCIQCSCVAGSPTPVVPTATMCIQPSPPLCQPNEHIECIDQNGTDFCIQCSCVAGTPAPTATVTSAAGSCNSIEMKYVSTGLNITAPQKGDNINFTCGEMAGAARYEFRLREPGSATFISINPISTGARVSEPYTITQAGAFRGQCRMCTGATEDTCLAWE